MDRSEFENQLSVLPEVVDSIARLEREVQQLRTAIDRATSWKIALSKFRTRVIAAILPRRIKSYLRRRQIAKTGFFDSAYYLVQNPDVAAAGLDPLHHYLAHGGTEGRDPHEMFDSSYYLEQNPDVLASGVNPLLHFQLQGLAEGRRPHPTYSASQYRAAADRGQAARKRDGAAIRAPNLRREPLPRRFQPSPLDVAPRHPGPTSAPTEKILVVSHVLPFPPRAGNEYRIHRMVQWLESVGYEVYLVVSPLPGETLKPDVVAQAAQEYRTLIVCQRDGTVLYNSERPEILTMLSELGGGPLRSFDSLERPLRTERSKTVSDLERIFCPDYLVDLLLRLEKSLLPNVVICNYVFMSRFLPLLRRSVLKVIDTHDVFSTKSSKVLRFGVTGDIDITSADEAALLSRADLIVAIQPDEAIELKTLAPNRTIVTAGVDFELMREVPSLPTESIVLYVASRNALNVKGVRDFLSLAWPLIRRETKTARMLIVGPICDAIDEIVEGVELLGRVDRLEDVYTRAKVVVNLAVAGTGVKIKTLEALSHLRPIVVWPSGVDGVSLEARRFCDIAENWYDFARRVVSQLASDGARELSTHREELGKEFSPNIVYGALRAAIETGMR